jgi:small-conductance mechanosensitive channel
MDEVAAWLTRHYVFLGTALATVGLLIGASVVIAVLNRLLSHWIAAIEARLHVSYVTVLVATRVLNVALWAIAASLVLEVWGVGLGGLWTLMASVAAVIGVGFLATWTMVSNFTASLFLSIWRPFSLGQVVEIVPENMKGRVIDRNLMFTALREDSGNVIQIPNNLFFQKIFRVADVAHKSPFERYEAQGNSTAKTLVTPEAAQSPERCNPPRE